MPWRTSSDVGLLLGAAWRRIAGRRAKRSDQFDHRRDGRGRAPVTRGGDEGSIAMKAMRTALQAVVILALVAGCGPAATAPTTGAATEAPATGAPSIGTGPSATPPPALTKRFEIQPDAVVETALLGTEDLYVNPG